MKERSIDTLRIDGGCLAFNFINTVNTRVEKEYHEYLNSYAEFLKWCRKVEALDDEEANELGSKADRFQQKASEALIKIIEARELLFALFERVSVNEKPETKVLEQFNILLSEALSNVKINRELKRYVDLNKSDLLSPLSRILLSAYEILMEVSQERLKKCDACAWLFVDTTKNGKRRYCSPETCGSNEKAKRYYYRKKAEG